jgi:hypothetical protein
MTVWPVPAGGALAPGLADRRAAPFTTGPRLGRAFRDRRRLAAPLPEPPGLEAMRAAAAGRAGAAQVFYRKPRRRLGLPSTLVMVVLLLADGCQANLTGSGPSAVPDLVVLLLCGPGVAFTFVKWQRVGQSAHGDVAESLPASRPSCSTLAARRSFCTASCSARAGSSPINWYALASGAASSARSSADSSSARGTPGTPGTAGNHPHPGPPVNNAPRPVAINEPIQRQQATRHRHLLNSYARSDHQNLKQVCPRLSRAYGTPEYSRLEEWDARDGNQQRTDRQNGRPG